MKTFIVSIILYCLFFCSCGNHESLRNKNYSSDSLILGKMVRDRESAMKNKDIESVMKQFSDNATWINSEGFYCANKKEIETFHYNLTHQDSIGYHYLAGTVKIRMLDNNNAIVYYPWRMDWFNTFNPLDTLEKEVGLMTLSAQKRNEKWWWIAVTNQHTQEFFEDLTKHKEQ